MAGRRGFKQFEKFKYEDGSEHIILFQQDESMFHCDVEGTNFTSENLNDLKKKVWDRLTEVRGLKWEPIISVEAERWDEERFEYERLFTARKADGEIVYKNWSGSNVKGTWDEDTGRPSHDTNLSEEAQTYPYSLEFWQALEKIKEDLKKFHGRVCEKITEKNGKDFVMRFVEKGGKFDYVWGGQE